MERFPEMSCSGVTVILIQDTPNFENWSQGGDILRHSRWQLDGDANPCPRPAPTAVAPTLINCRTAGKKYPPEIQKALGRAHTLYIKGHVVEASTELSRVVVQCSSVSVECGIVGSDLPHVSP